MGDASRMERQTGTRMAGRSLSLAELIRDEYRFVRGWVGNRKSIGAVSPSSRALARRSAKAALGSMRRLVSHQTDTIVHNDAIRPNGSRASRQPTSFVATVA